MLRKLLLRRYNMTEEDYRMLEVVITAGQPHKAGPQWKVCEMLWCFQSEFDNFLLVCRCFLFRNGGFSNDWYVSIVFKVSKKLSIHSHYNYRLWTFNAKHKCRQSFLHDLCYGWNPFRSCHVSGTCRIHFKCFFLFVVIII